MNHDQAASAAITVAIALASGMLAQSLARHLKLPGIVLLLATGVLLGPEVAHIVMPASLGQALHILVGFAVAVILFEGGMNLNLKRIRTEATVIRRLITTGALITASVSALISRLFLGWDWRLAILFGALVIVTGPTVITPLLRRIKVRHKVETVLTAEGVLIDAIGAVLAVVTLQVVISPSGSSIAGVPLSVVTRLGLGLLLGVTGGFLIALLLRFEKVVPEGLENVFTLSLVLALFQISNNFLDESGIMSVTAAGMVVGNMRTRVQRELLEFKEQLTTLFIGMLFVLLAADVRLEHVMSLGWPGAATLAALMLLVRPLNVFASTWRSGLTFKEKAFISWVAPRGVVAAAMASLFSQTVSTAGIPGGESLRAMVFLVIAGTVLIQGLSGGLVARLLGLRRPDHRGYAILGANALGRAVGVRLRQAGEEVTFVDNNPTACKAAEAEDFKVVYGNGIEERTMQRARLDERRACLAVTSNEEVNLLFCRRARKEFKVPRVYLASRRDKSTVSPATLREAGAALLFGFPQDIDLWTTRMRREKTLTQRWSLQAPPEKIEVNGNIETFEMPDSLILPLVLQRGEQVFPVSDREELRVGDAVDFAVLEEHKEKAWAWLQEHGWEHVEIPEPGRLTAANPAV